MKRIIIILKWLPPIVIAAGILAIVFSPYGKHEGFDYPLIVNTVDIDASPEATFHYLGNSAHAHDWSVYVDHLTTLNPDSFPDGTVGWRRRCFKQKDEQGVVWDEVVTAVDVNKRRQIAIYNMHGFSMQSDGLATEQLYQPLDGGKRCRLSFTVFYLHHNPSFWETLKTYFAAYKIKSIFEGNMKNIKRLVEAERH